MTRVAVFIDYQNTYMGARRALNLGGPGQFTAGQVYPRRLGLLATERGRTVDPDRELVSVCAYRGEPSAKHNQWGQAACQRQVRYWKSQTLVHAITRPLQYQWVGRDRYGKDLWDPREKGIDVQIAIDIVAGAINDTYDVCVLVSGDTDLLPALEMALDLNRRCEVAAWRGPGGWSPRLQLSGGRNAWCHWFDEKDYVGYLHDPTDYTKDAGTPLANP